MQQITYDQIEPGDVVPFYTSPGAPAAPATRGTRAFFGLAKDHGMQTDGSVTGGSWLQSFAAAQRAAIWAGTVNLTNPAYAAELAALENYAMSEFITP